MDVTNPVSRKLPASNTKGLSAAYGRILEKGWVKEEQC